MTELLETLIEVVSILGSWGPTSATEIVKMAEYDHFWDGETWAHKPGLGSRERDELVAGQVEQLRLGNQEES